MQSLDALPDGRCKEQRDYEHHGSNDKWIIFYRVIEEAPEPARLCRHHRPERWGTVCRLRPPILAVLRVGCLALGSALASAGVRTEVLDALVFDAVRWHVARPRWL